MVPELELTAERLQAARDRRKQFSEQCAGKGCRIKVDFHMADHATKQKGESLVSWMVEKEEGGRKRRYLSGVASGLAVDAHGEQMTEAAIASFLKQAQETDILLYFNHGKDFHDDVGILVKSEKLENGDWFTVYRLYDEDDDVPEEKLKRIETVWRQINGLAPYKKKRQFGFSIEGIIPEGKIRSEFGGESEGTFIDEVQLDAGVTLVTRPAYITSVAHAIEKAVKSWRGKSRFDDNLQTARDEEDFFKRKDLLDVILERSQADLFKSTGSLEEKAEQLRSIWLSYVEQLIELYRSVGFRIVEDESPQHEPDLSEKPRDQKSQKKSTLVSDVAEKLQRLTVLVGAMKTVKNLQDAAAIVEDLKAKIEMLAVAIMDPDKMEHEDPDLSEGPEDQEPVVPKEAEGNVSPGTPAEETVETVQPGLDPDKVKSMIEQAILARFTPAKKEEEPKSALDQMAILMAPLFEGITKQLKTMNENQKSLVNTVGQIEDFNGQLLKGYGIADEITKQTEPAEPVRRALRSEQVSPELKAIKTLIDQAAGAEAGGERKEVQLTKKEIYGYIFGGRK